MRPTLQSLRPVIAMRQTPMTRHQRRDPSPRAWARPSRSNCLGPGSGPDLDNQQLIAEPIHLAHQSRVKVNLARAQVSCPSGPAAVLRPVATTLTSPPSKPTVALAATIVRELPPTSTSFSRGENHVNSIRTLSLSP
jgi:hypothetical protein